MPKWNETVTPTSLHSDIILRFIILSLTWVTYLAIINLWKFHAEFSDFTLLYVLDAELQHWIYHHLWGETVTCRAFYTRWVPRPRCCRMKSCDFYCGEFSATSCGITAIICFYLCFRLSCIILLTIRSCDAICVCPGTMKVLTRSRRLACSGIEITESSLVNYQDELLKQSFETFYLPQRDPEFTRTRMWQHLREFSRDLQLPMIFHDITPLSKVLSKTDPSLRLSFQTPRGGRSAQIFSCSGIGRIWHSGKSLYEVDWNFRISVSNQEQRYRRFKINLQ